MITLGECRDDKETNEMSSVEHTEKDVQYGLTLRRAFLGWQCRVRQISMRENEGKPDDAVTPALFLPQEDEPLGHIITLICKNEDYSKTLEFKHLFLATKDAAERRSKALQLLSETYYQNHQSFSDMQTASFAPRSAGAKAIIEAGRCRLVYEAYGQRFDLDCQVKRLEGDHPFYQSTRWHNLLFNPNLEPGTIFLGFAPDWQKNASTSL